MMINANFASSAPSPGHHDDSNILPLLTAGVVIKMLESWSYLGSGSPKFPLVDLSVIADVFLCYVL